MTAHSRGAATPVYGGGAGIPVVTGGGGGGGQKSVSGGKRADLKNVIRTNAVEQALFSVAYITTRDNELPPLISWCLTIVEDVQLLSFSWTNHIVPDIPWILSGIVEPTRFLNTYSSFVIANAVGIALVFTVVLLIAFVLFATHRQTKVPIPALRLLRILATLAMTALSIPIASLFVGGIHCIGGVIPEYGIACTSPQHLGLLIFDAIGLLVFTPLIVIGSLVFIETSPTSDSPLARPHGRIDCLAVAMRIVFVFADYFTRDLDTEGKWLQMLLVAGGLSFLAVKMARTQPYYDSAMTHARIGLAVAAVASSIAAMVVVGAGSPAGWWIALPIASLAGLLFGMAVSKWYSRRYLAETIRCWHRVVRAEVVDDEDARLVDGRQSPMQTRESSVANSAAGGPAGLVVDVTWTTSASTGIGPSSNAAVDGNGATTTGNQNLSVHGATTPQRRLSVDGSSNLKEMARLRRPSAAPSILESFAAVQDNADHILNGLLKGTSMDALNAVRERQPKKRIHVFDSPLQVEVCIRFIRSNPTAKQISLGLQLLERGLVEFPKDPLLLLLAATYLSAFYKEEGARAADQLMRELQSTRNCPVDVSFLVYVRERSARDQGEHVLTRASINSLEREVRGHHLKSLYLIRDLWESIRTSAPAHQITDIVGRLAVYQAGAGSCYTRLLEINPRDKNTLRSYAQFLACVEADAAKATQILDLAEEVETQESRAKTQEISRHPSRVTSPPAMASDPAIAGSRMIKATAVLEPTKEASIETPPADRLVAVSSVELHERLSHSSQALFNNGGVAQVKDLDADNSFGGAMAGDGGGDFDLVTNNTRMNAGRAGSQTSGTSASRTQRQALQTRRSLLERLSRPLTSNAMMIVSCFLFLGSMILGFYACMQFFNSTSTLLARFRLMRTSRAAATTALESVRNVMFGNMYKIYDYVAGAVAQLRTQIAIMSSALPDLAAWDTASTVTQPKFRLYQARFLTNINNFVAVDATPLDIYRILLQSAQLTLAYTAPGAFTPAIWTSTPELRILTDNLPNVFAGLKAISYVSVNEYSDLVSTNLVIMMLCCASSIVFLCGVGMIVYRSVFHRYFLNEERVATLLRSVPKRVASNLLTQIEEEIESFREVTDGDEFEGGSLGEMQQPPSARIAGSGQVATDRGRKFKLMVLAAILAIGGMTAGMFTVTVQSSSLQTDMTRLVTSSDRRFSVVMARFFSLEYYSPDPTVSASSSVRNSRSAMLDMIAGHAQLVSDINGFPSILPADCIYPRDCNVPANCPDLQEAPEFGFTRSVASLPLDTVIQRFMDAEDQVINSMAMTTTNITDTTTASYRTWRLSLALSVDILTRLTAMHDRFEGYMLGRLSYSSALCIVMFVATLAVSATAVIVFVLWGVQRLRREARTLTAVLHLIPAPLLKEAPAVLKFIESGGVALDMDTAAAGE
ncbi:hypothetical protein H9P43_003866 [Blastocladiella emersonii ATCC 22665]|nr:hypothetical protein H9P43_003866 [Blastocladiella emersonii ATCC 22665]